MNKKRTIALMLLLVLITGALSGLSIAAGAAESDNTAVIKLYNNGELTETLSCPVGHVITVSTLLDTSSIDGGKISGVEGFQTYSSGSLSLMDELDEEEAVLLESAVPFTVPMRSGNIMCVWHSLPFFLQPFDIQAVYI